MNAKEIGLGIRLVSRARLARSARLVVVRSAAERNERRLFRAERLAESSRVLLENPHGVEVVDLLGNRTLLSPLSGNAVALPVRGWWPGLVLPGPRGADLGVHAALLEKPRFPRRSMQLSVRPGRRFDVISPHHIYLRARNDRRLEWSAELTVQAPRAAHATPGDFVRYLEQEQLLSQDESAALLQALVGWGRPRIPTRASFRNASVGATTLHLWGLNPNAGEIGIDISMTSGEGAARVFQWLGSRVEVYFHEQGLELVD